MRFSTKPYAALTGLSYYGYCFYAPALGRWLTRDPIGEAGGINLYRFVGNNPVNFIDPDGEHPAWVVGTAVVLTGYFLWEIFHPLFHPSIENPIEPHPETKEPRLPIPENKNRRCPLPPSFPPMRTGGK